MTWQEVYLRLISEAVGTELAVGVAAVPSPSNVGAAFDGVEWKWLRTPAGLRLVVRTAGFQYLARLETESENLVVRPRGGGGGGRRLPPAGDPITVRGSTNAIGTSTGRFSRAEHQHALEVDVSDAGGVVSSQPELRFLGAGAATVSVANNALGKRAEVTISVAGGGPTFYLHEQPVAALVWNIPHNLNIPFGPIIQVRDPTGLVLPTAETLNVDDNNATVKFFFATAGTARCI